jgi:hypothetical protein
VTGKTGGPIPIGLLIKKFKAVDFYPQYLHSPFFRFSVEAFEQFRTDAFPIGNIFIQRHALENNMEIRLYHFPDGFGHVPDSERSLDRIVDFHAHDSAYLCFDIFPNNVTLFRKSDNLLFHIYPHDRLDSRNQENDSRSDGAGIFSQSQNDRVFPLFDGFHEEWNAYSYDDNQYDDNAHKKEYGFGLDATYTIEG